MHPLVLLAKAVVENYIKNGIIISVPGDLPEEFLKRKAGTFVTIEKSGELRGCIGTFLPIRNNIAEETIYNVIAAATEDYRFFKIKEEELPSLSYTVYVLSGPELVKNISELEPKKFGIIVRTTPLASPDGADVTFDGHFIAKTGLLLPDLEGVDTVERQIEICCQKGGIDPAQEKILIYKFTVEKYQ